MRVLQTLQKIDSRSVSGSSAQEIIKACRRQSGGASEIAPDFAPDAFIDFLQVLTITGVTDVPSSPLFGSLGALLLLSFCLHRLALSCTPLQNKGLPFLPTGFLQCCARRYKPVHFPQSETKNINFSFCFITTRHQITFWTHFKRNG